VPFSSAAAGPCWLVTVPDRCAALRQQRAERELTAKVSALAHERRQLEQSMQARACLQFACIS
jgi:hypothetical protein